MHLHKVHRLSRTLSGVRRTKKFHLLATSTFRAPLFPRQNARVLHKKMLKPFFDEAFRKNRTLLVNGGIFAELRTVVRTVCGQCFEVASPKDQENHCMWACLHRKLRVSLIQVIKWPFVLGR